MTDMSGKTKYQRGDVRVSTSFHLNQSKRPGIEIKQFMNFDVFQLGKEGKNTQTLIAGLRECQNGIRRDIHIMKWKKKIIPKDIVKWKDRQ